MTFVRKSAQLKNFIVVGAVFSIFLCGSCYKSSGLKMGEVYSVTGQLLERCQYYDGGDGEKVRHGDRVIFISDSPGVKVVEIYQHGKLTYGPVIRSTSIENVRVEGEASGMGEGNGQRRMIDLEKLR